MAASWSEGTVKYNLHVKILLYESRLVGPVTSYCVFPGHVGINFVKCLNVVIEETATRA